jgi:hypothetical protein
MIKIFTNDMVSTNRAAHEFAKLKTISDEDIERLFNRTIENREDAKYVGLFVAIKKILHMEHLEGREYNEVFRRCSNYISGCNREGEIFEQIWGLGLNKIDFSSYDECTIPIVKYAAYFGSEKMKSFIEKAISNCQRLKDAYKKFVNESQMYQKIDASSIRTTIINNSTDFVYAFVDEPNGHPF